MLAQWISKNQNGHYPCIDVIEDTLKLLNQLPIDRDHLRESKIGKVVKKISKQVQSNTVQQQAKDLISKWYRMVYNLNGGYEQSGSYEEQYRQF